MLVVPGQGQNTLAGFELTIALNAAPGDVDLSVQFFDGNSAGMWDIPGSSQLTYELFPDPTANGSGVSGTPVATWLSSALPDNAWSTLAPVVNTPAAQFCQTCPYRYVLRVANVNNALSGLSSFKLRTDGTMGLRPQPFAFLNPRSSVADFQAVSPNYPSLIPSLYDGVWRFAFSVPNPGATQITLWDGDLDWGSANCSTKDTDDLNTPLRPSHVSPALSLLETPAVRDEGLAIGTINCADGSKASGAPADDAAPGAFTGARTPVSGPWPNLVYRVVLPNGLEYVNTEPSGNLEWERFVLDADPATDFDPAVMDQKVPSLPGGVYETIIEGNDAGNLNFFYSAYNLLGLPPNGPPASEDAFYRIDRYVWRDTDLDGLKDVGEPGIPGVVVARTDNDKTTNAVVYAITDANGLFTFRVPEGNYSLEVVPTNFVATKPLNGLNFTGGNTFGAKGELVTGLALGPANGYERRDFGYAPNVPPVANNDAGLCVCGGTSTFDVLANDSDINNDGLTVTGVTPPAHGTATRNANGTVTYAAMPGYLGPDSFTYAISDGEGGTATGTVDVEVMNNPAVLVNDSATTAYQAPVTVNVLANDFDPDGLPLTVTGATKGANGTTVVNANGTITYTPAAGFSGSDSFTYTVSDGCGSSMATVTITVQPAPPVGVCYVGSRNPNLGASQTWVSNPNGTMTLRTTLSQSFNDNTYGANQVGWPGRNHKYSHLVTSDMVQLALFDKNGARKMEFKLDYFSASTASATGWQSLGTWGGDGAMILGSQAHITSADSSLAMNFRQGPSYILTQDSPAVPNTTHPNWVFEMWYEVTVDPTAFGAAGFGYPRIVAMHASPSKSGVETEPLMVVDCAGNLTPANNDGGSPNGSAGGAANGKGNKK